jgi:hypothetical protein
MEAEASGVVEELPVGTDVIQSKQEIDIAENDYVAAIYQRKWYIGKVFSGPPIANVATPTNYTIAGCLADIHLAVTICRHGMEAHCSRNGF